MQSCRKAPDETQALSYIEDHIAQWIRGIFTRRSLAADHRLLDVIGSIELGPQGRQDLLSLSLRGPTGVKVLLKVRPQELVDASDTVGVDAVFPNGDDMGKPQRLHCFAEVSCRFGRNLIADHRDLQPLVAIIGVEQSLLSRFISIAFAQTFDGKAKLPKCDEVGSLDRCLGVGQV